MTLNKHDARTDFPVHARGHRLQAAIGLVRHGAGFVVAGLIAFSVDALVLLVLTKGAGINPYAARLVAIGFAMVAAWRAHRRLTFAVPTPARFREFAAYVPVAASAATVNYVVYASLLASINRITPLAAMVGATIVSMTVSYLGMRFGVFKRARL